MVRLRRIARGWPDAVVLQLKRGGEEREMDCLAQRGLLTNLMEILAGEGLVGGVTPVFSPHVFVKHLSTGLYHRIRNMRKRKGGMKGD